MMDPAHGALSTLRAALDDGIPDRSILGPGGFTGVRGDPKIIKEYNPKLSLDPPLRHKTTRCGSIVMHRPALSGVDGFEEEEIVIIIFVPR